MLKEGLKASQQKTLTSVPSTLNDLTKQQRTAIAQARGDNRTPQNVVDLSHLYREIGRSAQNGADFMNLQIGSKHHSI
jgi:hypothetical protein